LKAAYEVIGHATSDSTVYNLLHRHGWRKLMPRPFHLSQNFGRCCMTRNRVLKLRCFQAPALKTSHP
jgi:Winged helix-turn helix